MRQSTDPPAAYMEQAEVILYETHFCGTIAAPSLLATAIARALQFAAETAMASLADALLSPAAVDAVCQRLPGQVRGEVIAALDAALDTACVAKDRAERPTLTIDGDTVTMSKAELEAYALAAAEAERQRVLARLGSKECVRAVAEAIYGDTWNDADPDEAAARKRWEADARRGLAAAIAEVKRGL